MVTAITDMVIVLRTADRAGQSRTLRTARIEADLNPGPKTAIVRLETEQSCTQGSCPRTDANRPSISLTPALPLARLPVSATTVTPESERPTKRHPGTRPAPAAATQGPPG
jgi:hypothetical protein